MKIITVIILFLVIFTGDIKAKSITYTGTVVPILQCVYKAGTNYFYYGVVNKVPRVGQIVHPPVYDQDGKIITPGSILVQSKLNYHSAMLAAGKNKVKGIKDELVLDKANYVRYKKLSKSGGGAISELKYDKERAIYFSNKGKLLSAKGDVMTETAALNAMTDTASFTAIIDNVFAPNGFPLKEREIVELSQLNPIAVNIKMDKASARKISTSTPVQIYPLGNDKPSGILYSLSQRIDDGYQFAVYNTTQYGSTVNIDNKEIPVVNSINTVYPFYFIGNKKLGVPLKSIYKDDKGYYVWKGKGTKNMQPGVGLKEVFPVSKVYVKPGNMKRPHGGYTTYQILDDSGELELYDIVLVNIPKGLKDNSLVCYPKNNFLFMPGDKVKVVIEEEEISIVNKI